MKLSTKCFALAALLQTCFVFAEVKGEFKIDAAPAIQPKHACAYPVRDQFDPRSWQVEVVLSENAADAGAVVEELSPHTAMINQEPMRAANYILLWINPDGKVSMNATLSKTMTQYVDSTKDGLKAELTVNTKDRVAGHVYSLKPVKTMSGETYEVDVTFDTPVTRPKAGTKLPDDGPAKALTALYKGIQEKNLDLIKANVTPRVLDMLVADYNTPEENLKSAIDTLLIWLPKKNMKIAGGELRGDAAVLEVEGEIFEGTNALYMVRMVKGDAGWVLDTAQLAGMFK